MVIICLVIASGGGSLVHELAIVFTCSLCEITGRRGLVVSMPMHDAQMEK